MANDIEFRVKVIDPDRVFYEGMATMVEFNTTEGAIGVLKGHIPMTVIIAPGILNIIDGETSKKAALLSGFAEILSDEVVILAETVEWPEEIDKLRAIASKERAQERLQTKSSEIDRLRAETALNRALARISVIR